MLVRSLTNQTPLQTNLALRCSTHYRFLRQLSNMYQLTFKTKNKCHMQMVTLSFYFLPSKRTQRNFIKTLNVIIFCFYLFYQYFVMFSCLFCFFDCFVFFNNFLSNFFSFCLMLFSNNFRVQCIGTILLYFCVHFSCRLSPITTFHINFYRQ